MLLNFLAGIFSGLIGAAPMADTPTPLVQEIVGTCNSLLASVSAAQRNELLMGFDDPERTRWNYIPLKDPRNQTRGLMLAGLNVEQMAIVDTLLGLVLSSKGLDQTRTIRRFEALIKQYFAADANFPPENYDPGFYKLTIFGQPSLRGEWS